MVTLRDNGTGVPKIIDFGIAKATQQRLTEKTLFTEYHQFIGTPEYMSPEQARMGELDIDTRSDIYALGVLLYELLTGTTPFDGERLRSSAYDEMLKTIRETEPSKPSTRLNTLGDALGDVARHRHVEPGELWKIVRGDLDWVVMKALEKDRARRYETANELAMDIERHLQDEPVDEPVIAGPPSTGYRLHKFVRRNRTGVLFCLTVAAALVGGIVASTVLAVGQARARAAAEREGQRATVNFQMARDAVDEMTRVVEQQLVNVSGTEQVRRELLQKAQVFYAGFAEENRGDPALLEEIGHAYLRLGDIQGTLGNFDEAEQAFRQAITISERLSTEFPDCPQYRRSLAFELWRLGVLFKNDIRDKEEALKMYRRSFELRAELVEEFPNEPAYVSDLAWSHVDLGLVLRDLGRYEEARPELRRALFLRKQLVDRFANVVEYRDALAHSHHWLGAHLLGADELEEAEEHLRTTLELRGQLLAEDPNDAGQRGDLAHIKSYVGKLLTRQGKVEEAEKEYREGIAICEKLIEEFPGHVDHRRGLGSLLWGLSKALMHGGRNQEVEDVVRQSIANRKNLAIDFPDVAGFRDELAEHLIWLSEMLTETDQLEEALESCREALGVYEKLVSDFPDAPEYKARLGESYWWLGDVLEEMGRSEDAQQAYRRAEEIEKEVMPEETEDN
jgi:tetratricopeptide (TPR) repeat protein